MPRLAPALARLRAGVLAAALTLGPVTPAAAQAPALNPHLDCAGTYSALSLALPYLPGVFLMFRIAPRSGRAQSAYIREANPVSHRAVREASERRKHELLAQIADGTLTLDELIRRARDCDARYGLDPVPVSLDDVFDRDRRPPGTGG